MNKLSQLVALVKKRKRVGRGGDKGGTSGRGHQGQGSRSGGNVPAWFEGGQMPLTRRLPKRGFSNAAFKEDIAIVNLQQLDNKFSEGEIVSRQTLIDKGLLSPKTKARIKILGNGTLQKKLIVEVDAISSSALQAIEKHGGTVRINQEM